MSSKVDDFGTNRKRVCDFLLVGHCDYGPILHRLRYGDLLAKNYVFFIPLSYSALPVMLPLEFHGEIKPQETRVMGAYTL